LRRRRCGECLQRPGGLDLLAHHAARFAVGAAGHVDAAAFVEDAQDGELLGAQLPLRGDHFTVTGLEPAGGVRTELVEHMFDDATRV
jgi:hypothetical protein